MKYTIPYLPILISGLVILIVVHIVTAKTNPIRKLWSSLEGFQAPILTNPQCPTAYKFFNDAVGESFCCKGTVNPFTHACTAKESSELCAFVPGSKDPRNPSRVLPLCSDVITNTHTETQTRECPSSLPHYASVGKCCFSGTDLDGRDCTDFDNKSPKTYCVLAGTPLKTGEQRCDALQRDEAASCPTSLQKTTYTLGRKEVEKYGDGVSGVQIPVCFNPTSSCIPENIISYAQSQGAWTDKNPATWSYACANWTRVNLARDTTGQYDTNYL